MCGQEGNVWKTTNTYTTLLKVDEINNTRTSSLEIAKPKLFDSGCVFSVGGAPFPSSSLAPEIEKQLTITTYIVGKHLAVSSRK